MCHAANLKKWSKAYSQAISVEETIVYKDAKEGQQQRPFKLLPISDEAIASQQEVADTFFKAGVLQSKTDVKPLWDNTFSEAITQCK